MNNMFNKTEVIIMCICFLILGIAGTKIYDGFKTEQKLLDGVRFEKTTNWTGAIQYANTLDRGDWVCVNVKGMTYEEGLETCNHEMAHEIFAEYCGTHMDKCMEVTNEE